MVFFGQGAQGLGQEFARFGEEGDFAAARARDRTAQREERRGFLDRAVTGRSRTGPDDVLVPARKLP